MEPDAAYLSLKAAHKAMSFSDIKEHACALAMALATIDEAHHQTWQNFAAVVRTANLLMEHLRVISLTFEGMGEALAAGRTDEVAQHLPDLLAVLAVHRDHTPAPELIPYKTVLESWPDAFTPTGE